MGTLEGYLKDRRSQGIKNGTLRRDLAMVRRVLNLALRLWRDERGLTWLETLPLIQLPRATDAREPHPLSREEQEVCGLRWEWEDKRHDPGTSVFRIPGQ
jgi:hypothetical protein